MFKLSCVPLFNAVYCSTFDSSQSAVHCHRVAWTAHQFAPLMPLEEAGPRRALL